MIVITTSGHISRFNDIDTFISFFSKYAGDYTVSPDLLNEIMNDHISLSTLLLDVVLNTDSILLEKYSKINQKMKRYEGGGKRKIKVHIHENIIVLEVTVGRWLHDNQPKVDTLLLYDELLSALNNNAMFIRPIEALTQLKEKSNQVAFA